MGRSGAVRDDLLPYRVAVGCITATLALAGGLVAWDAYHPMRKVDTECFDVTPVPGEPCPGERDLQPDYAVDAFVCRCRKTREVEP